MRSRDAVLRQVTFWITVLTGGLALVASQIGCIRPQTVLSAHGFPRASRRSPLQAEVAINRTEPAEAGSPALTTDSLWSQPRSVAKQNVLTDYRNHSIEEVLLAFKPAAE